MAPGAPERRWVIGDSLMKCAMFAAAVLAVASPALAGTVVFSDDTMSLASYATTTYADPAFNTASIVAQPGAVATEYTAPFGAMTTVSAPRFQFLHTGFVYDPSASGEILSIDASLDQALAIYYVNQRVNLANTPRRLRILAQQDGKLYEAASTLQTGMPFNSWYTTEVSGLTEADFLFFDPATPHADRTLTGLDFGGGAITFGFELVHFRVSATGNTNPADVITSYFWADNFQLSLNTQDPTGAPTGAIPEPSTWAMLILGFGLSGAAVRRRRAGASAAA